MGLTRERLSLLDQGICWAPQPGPQIEAFLSPADQLLFGGSAGGGKTALAIGLAITRHERTLFVRDEGKQLEGVIEELGTVLRSREGYNGRTNIWRLDGDRQVRFGGLKNVGDEQAYQGNPEDLLVVDEAANVREQQVLFLLTWLRTKNREQRCRLLLCTNPPQTSEGEWVIRWFAPWLDPNFPKPARPGELRWVARIANEDVWVDGPEPVRDGAKFIRPVSRTFIPSRVKDNRYYAGSDYERRLDNLPEPLRSQMRDGDFQAGRADDDWQVIPSAWVAEAMARWRREDEPGTITSLGVDPSLGGEDDCVIARRRGWRYDPLIIVPSLVARKGAGTAKRVLDVAGDSAPIHIDVIGIGSNAAEHLTAYVGRRVRPVNFAAASHEKDLAGNLKFANVRAAAWWRMREILSPERIPRVALPPDERLKADLCAPRYTFGARGIQIEDKEQLKKRLGRSPDRGDAVVLAALRTPPILTAGT